MLDFTIAGSKYTFENTADVTNTLQASHTGNQVMLGESLLTFQNVTPKDGKTWSKHKNGFFY